MATTPESAGVPETQPQPVAEPTPEPVAEPTPVEDTALEGDGEDMTLADLAGLDVSDIEEIRSERLPIGAFIFRGKSGGLSEMTNRDDERRIVATFVMEVAEVKGLVEKMPPNEDGSAFDPNSLIGKTHTERQYIVPEKASEGIGRIRAFISDVGLNSAGPLGGRVEDGVPPGIIDSFEGHLFPGTIKGERKDGETYARLKLPKKK